jgi:hypothetical protein
MRRSAECEFWVEWDAVFFPQATCAYEPRTIYFLLPYHRTYFYQ